MWAAIRAADYCSRVVLVDKGVVASSGVSTFIHVVTAPVSDNDVMPAMTEIVQRSTYIVDQVCPIRLRTR